MVALWLACRASIDIPDEGSWLNEGRVCLGPSEIQDTAGAVTGTLESDGNLVATVTFEDCGGCYATLAANCVLEREGDAIVLSSEASYVREDATCPAICEVVSATCELEGLPAGSYVVTHGADVATLTVPGPAPLCFGAQTPPVELAAVEE